MKKYIVGIIDDNKKLADQIRLKLELSNQVEVIMYADRGKKAIDELRELDKLPEILLMDIEMPGMDGIETTFRIKQEFPDLKIIVLTVFDSEDNIFHAIKAGANGYLLKDESTERIIQSFKDAQEGGAPMSPHIATKTLQMLTKGYQPETTRIHESDPEKQLSKREIEILELLSKGMKNAQVAESLFLSEFTVKKHIENIYQKVCVHSRVELINWYNQK